jgi:hypothetical protein
MTQEREYFIHFRQSIQNLNNAWVILQVIKTEGYNPDLVNAAFQFALIEYCKPYKCSYGKIKNAKGKSVSYTLEHEHIPPEYLPLHHRILAARDQIHAHSDLTILDTRVCVKDSPRGKIAGYVQNVIRGTEEMQNLDSIIDLIERTLDSMYEKDDKLKQNLPVENYPCGRNIFHV